MAKKKESLSDRLKAKLRKLGLTERKAQALAKGLVPTVRAAIKAESKQSETLPPNTPFTRDVIPVEGAKGVDLLKIMNGLTSTRTYVVAAVKSDVGIVAVRQFDPDYFNVKFYPDFQYWGQAQGYLQELGAGEFLSREYYQRFHCNKETLDKVLKELQEAAKPKSRMKGLMDRLKAVDLRMLLKRLTGTEESYAARA